MIVFTHSDCFMKFNGIDHPERKERLDSVINSLKSTPELEINFKEAPLAKMNEIILVHPKHILKKYLVISLKKDSWV
jgi:acetoin utilization deacetylase AcuC-like enzyme